MRSEFNSPRVFPVDVFQAVDTEMGIESKTKDDSYVTATQ
jgi:hypothetical protein